MNLIIFEGYQRYYLFNLQIIQKSEINCEKMHCKLTLYLDTVILRKVTYFHPCCKVLCCCFVGHMRVHMRITMCCLMG